MADGQAAAEAEKGGGALWHPSQPPPTRENEGGKEGGKIEEAIDPSSTPPPYPSFPPSWRLTLPNLTPYWLPRSSGGVSCTVDLQGLYILTAPNMSGKSTLMRAMAVAALLGNCGLMVPCLMEKGEEEGGGRKGWGGVWKVVVEEEKEGGRRERGESGMGCLSPALIICF